jgi:hypothetical protein
MLGVSPVNLFPVAHLNNIDKKAFVFDRVEDAVIAFANTIPVALPRQLFTARWPWVFGECLDAIHNALAIFLPWNSLDLFGGRRLNEKPIFPHDLSSA